MYIWFLGNVQNRSYSSRCFHFLPCPAAGPACSPQSSPPSRPPHLTLWGDKWGQAGVHSANTEVRADPGRRISIVISYFHGGFHWAPPTLSIRGPGPSWGPGGLPCGMWPRPGVMWPDAATANWTFYLNINSAVAFRSLTWLIYFSIKACS